jgi:thymidylate synthase
MVKLMNIIVFQQAGSGERKIIGIEKYGKNLHIQQIISIDVALPAVIDEPQKYISPDFDTDLVMNYLKHPDLSSYLIDICEKKSIPVISTGMPGKGFTPYTCCGLGKSERLGEYGRQFGFPEYEVTIENDRISHIEVLRGAPCGATWEAVVDLIGCPVEEAMSRLPRQVQYNCFANPSGWDPISGKSPVHYAGYVHIAALKKAIEKANK